MAKIIVTETFARTYELEVENLEDETIMTAIEGFNATKGPETEWVCTSATDEAGDEVVGF